MPHSTSSLSPGPLLTFLRHFRQRQICQCSPSRVRTLQEERRRRVPISKRSISTGSSQLSEMEVSPDPEKAPRWSQTPSAMRAPPKPPRKPYVKPLQVNNDAKKLDKMYTTFLGAGGDSLLSEETKWLAVTHKSFDFGRRGFNDRLSFLGKRILELQTSLALLTTTDSKSVTKEMYQDSLGREPFDHPATDMAEVLIGRGRQHFTHYKTLAALGERYGIPGVVRWLPNDPNRLEASGCGVVYAQSMLAIVGALALEQGGEVANRITKERILTPLGAYWYNGRLDRPRVVQEQRNESATDQAGHPSEPA